MDTVDEDVPKSGQESFAAEGQGYELRSGIEAEGLLAVWGSFVLAKCS